MAVQDFEFLLLTKKTHRIKGMLKVLQGFHRDSHRRKSPLDNIMQVCNKFHVEELNFAMKHPLRQP